MSKTPFSSKCEILGDLWLVYKDRDNNGPNWQEFFDWANVGLPLAYFIGANMVTPTEDGDTKEIIEQTWLVFCEVIGVDPNEEYSTLQEAFDATEARSK
jgi:hypothetical protein